MSQVIAFAPVRKAVTVDADRKRAFEIFASGHWWPGNQTMLPPDSKRRVVMEPRAGGRWYERNERGEECDWGKVLSWEPHERMLLRWSLDGRFQYNPDLHMEVEIRFTTTPDGKTRVDVEHRNIEVAGETARALRDAVDAPTGWPGTLASFGSAVSAAA